jgi:hypothetical protein
MAKLCGFFVEVTERERGWGRRFEGYMVFNSEADADACIKELTADRTGPAPDCYDSYEKIGWKPISEFEDELLKLNGYFWKK